MNENSWLFQYPKEALIYFINELKLNGELPMNVYKYMNKGDLARHILTDGQGLEKLTEYINRMPIFQNDKYMDCWKAAFPEDGNICKKVSYGACAYDYATGRHSDKPGTPIAFANNKPVGLTIDNNAAYCSDCADANKASRISLDGCDYAVSWLLGELFNRHYQPRYLDEEVSIYEAGFSVENGFRPVWYSGDLYSPHSLKIFAPFGFKRISEVVESHGQAIWHELSLESLRAVK